MTLYNPIPQVYVPPRLPKGKSTAFSSPPHYNGMAISNQNCHLARQKKQLGFDYSSISNTLAPEECDYCFHCSHKQASKFNKTTGLRIFASSSMVQSCCKCRMIWIVSLAEFPCHAQPRISHLSWGASPWLVCNRRALSPSEPGTTGTMSHALQSSLTCCKGSLSNLLARHLLSITKPFATSQH